MTGIDSLDLASGQNRNQWAKTRRQMLMECQDCFCNISGPNMEAWPQVVNVPSQEIHQNKQSAPETQNWENTDHCVSSWLTQPTYSKVSPLDMLADRN